MSLHCYKCNYNFSSSKRAYVCPGCDEVIDTNKCDCWEEDLEEESTDALDTSDELKNNQLGPNGLPNIWLSWEYEEESTDALDTIFKMQRELNDMVFEENGIMLTSKMISDELKNNQLGPNGLPNIWLMKFLGALEDECDELREELLRKWWSKDKLDLQNIKVEIIDIFHFWVSLCLCTGIGPEDLLRIYKQKHQVNMDRQRNGYSRSTKDESDNMGIK